MSFCDHFFHFSSSRHVIANVRSLRPFCAAGRFATRQLNRNFPFPEAWNASTLFLRTRLNRTCSESRLRWARLPMTAGLRAKDGKKVFHVEIWSNTAPDFRPTFKASVKNCTRRLHSRRRLPFVKTASTSSIKKELVDPFDSAEEREGRDPTLRPHAQRCALAGPDNLVSAISARFRRRENGSKV